MFSGWLCSVRARRDRPLLGHVEHHDDRNPSEPTYAGLHKSRPYHEFASWMRNKVTTKAGNKTAASAKPYHIGNAVSRVIGAPKYVEIWMGTLIRMNPKMNIERVL